MFSQMSLLSTAAVNATKLCRRREVKVLFICSRKYKNSAPSITVNMASKPTVIDLRSDTVTKPTEAMRKAMYEADVGDDVFGEDPTVKALEQRTAKLLGMEAALYVPSGTMANLIAAMTHCQRRGAEVLLGDSSHMFLYEQGALSQIAGIQPNILRNAPDGTFDLNDMLAKIRDDDVHSPVTSLVCVENTHNFCGGKVLPVEWTERLLSIAKGKGIPVHLDGARLLNAAVRMNVAPDVLVNGFSSCTLCLSKGLGAPVGSVLTGSTDFIRMARRARKALGGGMRQAGVLAAAGLVALDVSVEGLSDDHAHAQMLAKAINQLRSPICHVDPADVHTNIVMIDCKGRVTAEELWRRWNEVGVKTIPFTATRVRAVFHRDVSRSDVDGLLERVVRVVKELH